MLAHREQSILRQHDKDPQHNDKNLHGLFGVFVCFAGIKAENRRALIYRGLWML